jgi:hypothetical protein
MDDLSELRTSWNVVGTRSVRASARVCVRQCGKRPETAGVGDGELWRVAVGRC